MLTPLDALYAPLLGPHYAFHRWLTGRYGAGVREKTGRTPSRIGDAPALWLHAVSLGEAMAAAPLWRVFRGRHPEWDAWMSTTTLTGRGAAESLAGSGKVFYFPIDFSWMVRRALDRVRPSLIVLMELEIWPQFLAEAARRGIPVAVAAARVTERSERRYALVPGLAKRLFGRVSLWMAQSEAYAQRLIRLGAPPDRVAVTGSPKYDAIPGSIDPAPGRERRALVDGRSPAPLLVAGSTHPGEEEAVLGAWRALRRDYPELRLFLAPRHPERFDAALALMRQYAPTVRRSALAAAAGEGDIPPLILGDTMGELPSWYQAADIAFVGGTLSPRGGQNIIEPCGLGVPTVCGPSLFNFAEAGEVLRAVDGLRVVSDASGLPAALDAMLRSPEQARAMGLRARSALLAKRGSAERMVELLEPYTRI